ncbi:hypothetical protein CBE90_00790 [Pasteurella multocida]|uniref:hypothetical protein n=1 Tax=Pasteurella multocida TaxID=747 RepID=UPI000CE7C4D9|nr:hypothetical protein [Pasteurella multocida]PPE96291.1 hypothetical protein CBE90_00790 [Pasteurella multocida]PPE97198.1 hypothetical protein CBE91_03820 [Pasteurella multocida]
MTQTVLKHIVKQGERWDIRYEKADKIHNHSYSDIVDFNEGVAAQFFYQKTENFEVFKYPDGSMIQIYKSNPILNHGNTSLGFTFNWAQAFKSNPALTWSVYSEQGLRTLQEQLAVQRMRKYELKNDELSEEELQQIHDDIIGKMKALAEAQQ